MSKFRDQLIQIQKKNYRRNMRLVKESLERNPSVDIYEKEYQKYLTDYADTSTKPELLKKILTADVVFHGDYHTLRQSQRSVLRILRDIISKRKVILCLEMFYIEDQKIIDRFMANQISENTFLNRIDYNHKWPFAWKNWRPIIAFCKKNQIPILGLNSKNEPGMAGLKKRDNNSAKVIAKTIIRNPGTLIYVVDGDFHISPNHLPKDVDTLLKPLDIFAKKLIIYQNAEKLYWKLCLRGKEEHDVLKINENSYCIMNTMPANKIQSYLNWLEYSEDAYYPVHGEWEDDGFGPQGITVQEIVHSISTILGLDIPPYALQKLNIYYANNLYFMDLIHKIPELKDKKRLIREKIKRGEGFLLEYGQTDEDSYLIYLPNSSINMAAEEATHFIHAVLRGRLTEDISPFDAFYQNVMTECLGFFGSKFINEKRKSHSENSVRRLLGQIKRGEYKPVDQVIPHVARYILQHLCLQRKSSDPGAFNAKFEELFSNNTSLPIIFSTQLGYILGNKLYYEVKRGKFPITKIREYFKSPFDKSIEAFNCYLEISRRLSKVKHVTQF